jgi:hypothetical protein
LTVNLSTDLKETKDKLVSSNSIKKLKPEAAARMMTRSSLFSRKNPLLIDFRDRNTNNASSSIFKNVLEGVFFLLGSLNRTITIRIYNMQVVKN